MRALLRFAAAILLLVIFVGDASAALWPAFRAISTTSGSAPTNSVAPTACASPQVGVSCAGGNGTWTGSPTFTYQWKSPGCTTNISGATSINYSPVVGDVGNTLCLAVTGTNGFGSLTVNSNVTAAVTANSGSVAFALPTSVTLKFMDPSGNDACNGTSASLGSSGNCAWASVNHGMPCGGVIVAATGNYAAASFQTWGTVATCPSTTGGIDGAGGIFFATVVCAGNVGTCQVNHPTALTVGIDVTASNWAVEGFMVSMGYSCSSAGYGFTVEIGTNQLHHVAFINDISTKNASGFTANTNTGTNVGMDYIAFVGGIAQDSAGRCDSFLSDGAVDIIGTKNWDTNAGTHIFVNTMYSYNNQQTLGAADGSDGECYIMDTEDALNYTQQIVISNNISAVCERFGIQLFYQGITNDALTMKVYGNTLYAGNILAFGTNPNGASYGDINIQSTAGNTYPWITSIYNNNVSEKLAHPGGNTNSNNYAYLVGGTYTNVTTGNTGTNPASSQNFMKGLATSCPGTCNSPNFDVVSFGTSTQLGVNTYTDPAYANVTDLFNNQIGTPSCALFQTTTQCMGYDPYTQTLTTLSVIGDLQATAGGAGAKGFQLPSASPVANSDYPTWLKGINRLKYNSGTNSLTEESDLASKPSGM